MRFAVHWTGDDPSGMPLMLGSLLLYVLVSGGIYGVLFQAAADSKERLPFFRWSAGLFLPLLWLLFKIGLIESWLIVLAATLVQVVSGQPLPTTLLSVEYWGRPLFDLLTQLLALYSVPVCILARVRRVWRPVIRDGVRTYRSAPRASLSLLLILVSVAVCEGGLHFSLGRDAEKAPPGIAEGMVAFLSAYLTLVAFYGAMRVVLTGPVLGPRTVTGRDDAAAPGPPA